MNYIEIFYDWILCYVSGPENLESHIHQPFHCTTKKNQQQKTGKLLLFAMKTNMCNLMQSLQFFHVLLGVLCFLLQMFPNISSWVSWYFGGDNAPYPHPIGSMYGILYLPTFGWFLWWIGGKYIYIYIICIYIYYTWTLWVLVPTKNSWNVIFQKRCQSAHGGHGTKRWQDS